MDEVNKGKLSLTERFDITNTEYEYQGEHDNYVAAFGGSMTIPEMQEYFSSFTQRIHQPTLWQNALVVWKNSMVCSINTVNQKVK